MHDRRLTFPVPVQEQRVAVPPEPVQDQRVAVQPESVPEQRVVSTDTVQEHRVVLPSLAVSNPIHTTPMAPLPNADVLFPRTYPPPPGLSAHPDTDQPNSLLGDPVTPPTVPTAPARRNLRPHVIRVPSIYGYSAVTVPAEPYLTLVRGNNTSITQNPHLSRSEIADHLSAADTAWTRQIDHVSRANSTTTDPYIVLAQQDIDMITTAMDDTVTGSANRKATQRQPGRFATHLSQCHAWRRQRRLAQS